jgi:hypothetical protein
LNRGGRYARQNLFRDLEKTGFDTVVSIESGPARYDIEELSARFPFVRFVLLQDEISMGEQINLAVSEFKTPLFFVLWNDLRIIAGGTARRMAERLSYFSENAAGGEKGEPLFKRLCTVPVIQNSRFETLPTLMVPALHRKKVKTLFLNPESEGLPSLYPFDGTGIYDRERFIRLGGFDITLKQSYWQLMDFGFRAWLWGEEIAATKTLKLSYETSVPAEDNSVSADYYRFYLKNLAPVFQGDSARLPLWRFPGYLLKFYTSRSDKDTSSAWEEFSESRRWVKTNHFRWRCGPKVITSRWNLDAAVESFSPENGE